MKFVHLFFLFCVACSTPQNLEQGHVLQISEIAPDQRSHLTTQNLSQLTKVYDLAPYIISKEIQIQSGVPSKHSPIITLNTRFAENPPKLLSAFLHEQFHWWLKKNENETSAAVSELKSVYPKIKDHAHLIVCYLEYSSNRKLLGEDQAKKIIQDFIDKDKIYPWHNSQVLKNELLIRKIILKHHLMLHGLN